MAEINYPTGKKLNKNKIENQTGEKKLRKIKASIETYNRGMLFEHELNESNKYYLIHDVATIYKKPTPIQIVKVDYPKRSKARIVEAYYQTPSTTDYNGLYKKRYIDFEAKQTDSNLFPFKNISVHQVNHLKRIDEQGGIAFVIIYFKKLDQVFIIDIKDFYKVYIDEEGTGSRSLKAKDCLSIGAKLCEIGYAPRINYLKAVDELYNI